MSGALGGKIAIVTGAASGIGLAIAVASPPRERPSSRSDIEGDPLEALKQEAAGAIHPFVASVASRRDVTDVFADCRGAADVYADYQGAVRAARHPC